MKTIKFDYVKKDGSESQGELLIKNSLNKKDFSVEDEKVKLRLNDEVSVVNIPLVAWEFYIGGYQPAQRVFKNRLPKSSISKA